MKHKYGEFTSNQIAETKHSICSQIFFLLLIVDNKTKKEYEDIDVNKAFENILYKLSGLNSILMYPVELVNIVSLIESANIEYNNPNFEYRIYRKLILDSLNEVSKIKEV